MPIAVVFDYDKTLSPHHMQEDAIFGPLGIDAEAFWRSSDVLVRERKYDRELAWMYRLLEIPQFRAMGRDELRALGRRLVFYPGVPEIFDELRNLEFYIVTAGMQEILEGSPLAPRVRKIFGCEYDLDDQGRVWRPKRTIGHTTKTQMLFRINKNLLDMNEDVNIHMPDEQRRIPFENILYVGDGPTDVPCFTVVTKYGGRAIAVYNPSDARARAQGEELFRLGRVDRVCPADYSRGSELRKTIEEFVDSMRRRKPAP